MTTLELSNADDDYFGDNLFSVQHLNSWLNAKGLILPADQRINGYLFVQVYTLLSEIHSYAYESISDEKSYALALRGLAHPENFYRPASKIKVSLDVANQWRALLITAVQSGELMLLDYASKLPVLAPVVAPIALQGDYVNGHEWKAKAWAMAAEIHSVNFARGWGHDKMTVAAEIEKMFGPAHLNLTTKTGRPIDRAYIVRYALQGWSKRFGKVEKREKK